MKRLISALLMLAFLLTTATAVLAATPETQAADTLYALGLFKGTGTDENGDPIYELERSATRIEALVMLIRLLGKETEAKATAAVHPFTDVPDWAAPYVAYAYAQGLTHGVSDTEFGSVQLATGNMYLTFVLRALGYQDTGDDPDFNYSTATTFAAEAGVTDQVYSSDDFLRGDAAAVSLSALSSTRKDSDETLIQSLVSAGAVSADAAETQGFDTASTALKEGEQVSIPLTAVDELRDEFSRAAVKAAFPDVCYMSWQIRHEGENDKIYDRAKVAFLPTASFQEFCILEEMVNSYESVLYREENHLPAPDFAANEIGEISSWDSQFYPTNSKPYLVLLDRELNVIGLCDAFVHGSHMILRRELIDTGDLLARFLEAVDRGLANKDTLEVFIDDNNPFEIWEHDTYTSCACPIYLDGEPMTSDYYICSLKYQNKPDWEAIRRMEISALMGWTSVMSGADGWYRELSDTFRDTSYAYGDSYALYFDYDRNCGRNFYLLIGIFDKQANMVGYTVLDPTV